MQEVFSYIGQGFLVLFILVLTSKGFKKLKKSYDDYQQLKKEKEERELEIQNWKIGDFLQVDEQEFDDEFLSQNIHDSGILYANLAKWNKNECEATFANGLSFIFSTDNIIANFSCQIRMQQQGMIDYMEKTNNKTFDSLMEEYSVNFANAPKIIPSGSYTENSSQQPLTVDDLNGVKLFGVSLKEMNVQQLNLAMDLSTSFEKYEISNAISNFIKQKSGFVNE